MKVAAHAIAGLRGLVDKYPSDSRYQIALGRILTYNPKTRGRRAQAAGAASQRCSGGGGFAAVAAVGLFESGERGRYTGLSVEA